MERIKGKNAVVTGGGSGMGRLIALSLAERGARVRIWDIDAAAMDRVVAEAAGRGLALSAARCDLSDKADIFRAAAETKAALGPVGILVNCAGVVSGKTFLETPEDRIELTLAVNLAAPMWTARAFLPDMIAADEGCVATIASAAGLVGVRGLADYSASKFGVVGFDEALRMELRARKSRVSTLIVCPFFVDTGMFDGVKTRVPLLLPILKSAYAARRIVDAIARGKRRLVMPRFVLATWPLRLLPVAAFDFLCTLLGVNASMDEFRGRGASS